MCECGCGATDIQAAYQIAGTQIVIGLQVYPGCEDCDYGPGVAILVFDSPKNEWLAGVKIQRIKADEYGGNQGHGIGVPIFDPENLRAEAAALEEADPIAAGYESLGEWLDEYGVGLITGAVARRRKQRGGLS